MFMKRFLGLDTKHSSEPHSHESGQFVLVKQGILHGGADNKIWLLWPCMAVWIPPYCSHWGRASERVELAVLYLPPKSCATLPTCIKPLVATPLMTALCDRLLQEDSADMPEGRVRRMLDLLIDEIAETPAAGMVLPLPEDVRLKRLTDALIAEPATRLTLAEWGRRVGATARTLLRLFRKETCMSYSEWYDKLLLVEAQRRLVNGLNNEQLAEELGFATGDSFSHWFRRQTGSSPRLFRDTLSGGTTPSCNGFAVWNGKNGVSIQSV